MPIIFQNFDIYFWNYFVPKLPSRYGLLKSLEFIMIFLMVVVILTSMPTDRDGMTKVGLG